MTIPAHETFICPECGREMIRSPLDPEFLMHVESTDCAPEPWPTPEDALDDKENALWDLARREN